MIFIKGESIINAIFIKILCIMQLTCSYVVFFLVFRYPSQRTVDESKESDVKGHVDSLKNQYILNWIFHFRSMRLNHFSPLKNCDTIDRLIFLKLSCGLRMVLAILFPTTVGTLPFS